MIKQVHGVMGQDANQVEQRVQITDDLNAIKFFHTGQGAIYLTMEEARFLASELAKAANRLRARAKVTK